MKTDATILISSQSMLEVTESIVTVIHHIIGESLKSWISLKRGDEQWLRQYLMKPNNQFIQQVVRH